MTTTPFRIPFWATTLSLVGVIVLCGLGSWQLQRLQWKNDLLDRIETARTAVPLTLDAATIAPLVDEDGLLVRGTLTGRYLHDHEIFLKPRPMGQKTGAHLVTPFLLSDGQTIVPVLRGWVSDDPDTFIQRPDPSVTITGTLRHPTETNAFTPQNIPDKNMWFTLDPAALAASHNLENVVPLAFYEETKRDDVGWPLPVEAWQTPNNNHLSYAIFWFTMAGILIIMYGLRFIVYGRKPNDDTASDETGGAGNGST
ncbi:SURF1 family protein [Micavibrio aeruginosavorus]|uniref:SURF1 family protein n=1 Tax=Micavibrio aeruginosavorus TaxID=349221 RepID=UPI003F4AC13D